MAVWTSVQVIFQREGLCYKNGIVDEMQDLNHLKCIVSDCQMLSQISHETIKRLIIN